MAQFEKSRFKIFLEGPKCFRRIRESVFNYTP